MAMITHPSHHLTGPSRPREEVRERKFILPFTRHTTPSYAEPGNSPPVMAAYDLDMGARLSKACRPPPFVEMRYDAKLMLRRGAKGTPAQCGEALEARCCCMWCSPADMRLMRGNEWCAHVKNKGSK